MDTVTDTARTALEKTAPPADPAAAPVAAPPRKRVEFAVNGELEVCVVGLGYIGLPTASLLAAKGAQVRGVDVRPEVVETINDGRVHIVEPDLDLVVRAAVGAGRLTAASGPAPSDVFLIAVPTPLGEDNQPDLDAVRSAADAVSLAVRPGNLVLLESTSPVGTTRSVVVEALEARGHRVGEDVFVAYCPERVLPGRILTELVDNDRVVGGVDEASTEAAVSFYASFVRGEVVGTDAETAEIVKLAENSYRDVNVAFANELSMIASRAGVSVWEVIRLANRHPRVDVLQPGPGVGGHCLSVDPWFLVSACPEDAPLIATARGVNDKKPEWVLERVRACAAQVKEPVIACLGLAFKADVDDLRGSPALEIVRRLREEAAGELLVVEPNLVSHPEFELVDLQEAIERANIVLVLVDHQPFRRLRREVLHEKLLIDTRGVFL